MAAKAARVHFGPEAIQLPALPSPGPKTRVVYELTDFSESGVHGFIRLAEGLAPLMGASKLPPARAQQVARLAGGLVEIFEDGLDFRDIPRILQLVAEAKNQAA